MPTHRVAPEVGAPNPFSIEHSKDVTNTAARRIRFRVMGGVAASLSPWVEQDEAVGIPQGTETGPNILFFVDGLGQTNHATSFSLTGPGGGAVETKMVDSTTSPPPGESYKPFRTGGDMIVVHPLDPFTDYTASVT